MSLGPNIKESPAAAVAQPVALVTGGAGAGIGHGITCELALAGWAVLIVDRDERTAQSLVNRLRSEGKAAAALALDITTGGAAERAVSEALQRFGRLDGLVNNAGIGLSKIIDEAADEDAINLFAVDCMAAFRFTRAALPALRKSRGAIVNIGSVHATRAHPTYAIYASAKAALEAFTRGTAIENGPRGVRANCVHPGYVESPQNHALIQQFTGGKADAWLAEYVETKQCVQQSVTAEHVGALVAFLLGDKAPTITGQTIVIDGGTSIMLFDAESRHEDRTS